MNSLRNILNKSINKKDFSHKNKSFNKSINKLQNTLNKLINKNDLRVKTTELLNELLETLEEYKIVKDKKKNRWN